MRAPTFVRSMTRTEFVPPGIDGPRTEQVVVLSVSKLIHAWKQAADYLRPYEGVAGKYAALIIAVENGRPWEMPHLHTLTGDVQDMIFGDGRHKTALCRDLGLQSVPVLVPSSQVALFSAALGAHEKDAATWNQDVHGSWYLPSIAAFISQFTA